MSSEQRYTYSYAPFLTASEASSGLFGKYTATPGANLAFDGLKQNYFATGQQFNPPFFNDTSYHDHMQQFETLGSVAVYSQFDTFAGTLTMPSASNTDGFVKFDMPTTITGAGDLIFDAGVLDQKDGLETIDNLAGPSQLDCSGFEITQPYTIDASGASTSQLATHYNDVAHGAPLDWNPNGPVDPSVTSMPCVQETKASPTGSTKDVNTHTEWSGPRKCHWRNCTSKATFHSLSALNVHIRNLHVSPLLCTFPGCSYKKPFGKQCDLKRHIATIHSNEHKYRCDDPACQETFARHDKKMNHVREKHQFFKCSYNHCGAEVFASQLESHLQASHGPFDCAVGSCEFGGMSRFTELNLYEHLVVVHNIMGSYADFIIPRAKQNMSSVGVMHVQNPLLSPYYIYDCAPCFAKKNVAQESLS